MKMLMVCCESGLDLKVVEVLEEAGAPGYTVCEQLKGMGATGRKHGNPIWPGHSVVVHACVDEAVIPTIVQGVRQARDEYVKRPGCAVFAVPVERLL